MVTHYSTSRRVLVVDDNEDSADVLALHVRLWGYETDVAYSGASAIDLARSRRPDAVLLDLAMPDMDGYEVVSEIRKLEGFERVPFMAITALVKKHPRQRALDASFIAYVQKPVDHDEVHALLAVMAPTGSPGGGPGSAPLVSSFIEERCDRQPRAEESVTALWKAFREHCASLHVQPGKPEQFFRVLEDRRHHGLRIEVDGWVRGLRLRQPHASRASRLHRRHRPVEGGT